MVTNVQLIPECPRTGFWVFGYGSLMWRPGFDYEARRTARLYGFRRALCILSYVYRGTPEEPGLVFGLDAGGSCVGRVFRVDAARRREAYEYIMEREMIQGVYRPCWLPVHTAEGRVEALCFVADRRHEQYSPALTEDDIVRRVRSARGRNGANIDYIVNTRRHLEELGIPCRALGRICDAAVEQSKPA